MTEDHFTYIQYEIKSISWGKTTSL